MVICVPPAVSYRLLPGTQYPIAALLYRTRMPIDAAIEGIDGNKVYGKIVDV
jgi:hypothetical protein